MLSNREQETLHSLVNKFVDAKSNLLTQTAAHGPRLNTARTRDGLVAVGYQIKSADDKGLPVPLSIDGTKANFGLQLLYTFDLDETGKWLQTVKSHCELLVLPEEMLFAHHYDRHPTNSYCNPHLHVAAHSDAYARAFELAGRSKDQFKDTHVPVGGLVEQSIIEDTLDYGIREELFTGRPGWEEVIKKSRHDHYEYQLQALLDRQGQ